MRQRSSAQSSQLCSRTHPTGTPCQTAASKESPARHAGHAPAVVDLVRVRKAAVHTGRVSRWRGQSTDGSAVKALGGTVRRGGNAGQDLLRRSELLRSLLVDARHCRSGCRLQMQEHQEHNKQIRSQRAALQLLQRLAIAKTVKGTRGGRACRHQLRNCETSATEMVHPNFG